MAKREPRGLELAMMIEGVADYILIHGTTGPISADILRDYAQTIRKAPDFGANITWPMWRKEIKSLMLDLQVALAHIEAKTVR